MCILSFRKKKLVGEDEFGNKYYRSHEKRFIKYSDNKDPTTISPYWYLWLHYAVDEKRSKTKMDWQLERIPNRTGTKFSYNPRNAQVCRDEDYSPWKPIDQ